MCLLQENAGIPIVSQGIGVIGVYLEGKKKSDLGQSQWWDSSEFSQPQAQGKKLVSYSLKYRPSLLAPRASKCLCLFPLKASGSFNLSFRKSQAGERNWNFTCRLGPLSTAMRRLKLSASWEHPPLLADNTEAGSRSHVVTGGLHTFQPGRAYVLQEIVRWEGLPDFLWFLPLDWISERESATKTQ